MSHRSTEAELESEGPHCNAIVA